MIIIGFCRNTSKILPRLFCRNFVHTAPILVRKSDLEMWQFIKFNKIVKIPLKSRDLNILSQYGWVFIVLDNCNADCTNIRYVISCVQLAKNMMGLRNWRIQTPDALYKELSDRRCKCTNRTQ